MAKLWRLTSRPMRATSTVIKRTPAQSGCFSRGFFNPECGWQRPICMSCMWARVDGSCFPCWWPVVFDNVSSIIFVGHYIYNIIWHHFASFLQQKETILCCFTSQNFHGLHRFPDSHWFPIIFHFPSFPSPQSKEPGATTALQAAVAPNLLARVLMVAMGLTAMLYAELKLATWRFTVEISSVTSWGCIDYTNKLWCMNVNTVEATG